MSYLSDFKSAPIELFNQYKGVGTYNTDGSQNADTSYLTLCGTRFKVEGDGREVALVSIGATAIVSGVLVQGAAEVTAFEKLAMTVPTATPGTAGTNQILVTNGATVLNVNQFIGGYLIISAGTGLGQTLKIASHQPAAASATFLVTTEDNIQVTLDATSKVSLVSNPYTNIIINPATATGAPIGASLYPLTASTAATFNATTGVMNTPGTPQFGFVVVHGPTGILVDATVTNVGYPLGRSATVAGAVGVATLTTVAAVGTAMQTLTSAQAGPVYLNL